MAAYTKFAITFYAAGVSLLMFGLNIVGWYLGVGEPEDDETGEAMLRGLQNSTGVHFG